MGDRTYQRAVVFACPAEHIGTVLDVLNDRDYVSMENQLNANTTENALVLGEEYVIEEAYLGTAGEVANALAEVPGVVFEVSEDPKYEFPGVIYQFTPELGLHEALSGADNQAYLPVSEWMRVTETAGTREELVGRINALLGVPHEVAIRAARAAVDAAQEENTG